jgi:hypothetical protein
MTAIAEGFVGPVPPQSLQFQEGLPLSKTEVSVLTQSGLTAQLHYLLATQQNNFAEYILQTLTS